MHWLVFVPQTHLSRMWVFKRSACSGSGLASGVFGKYYVGRSDILDLGLGGIWKYQYGYVVGTVFPENYQSTILVIQFNSIQFNSIQFNSIYFWNFFIT